MGEIGLFAWLKGFAGNRRVRIAASISVFVAGALGGLLLTGGWSEKLGSAKNAFVIDRDQAYVERQMVLATARSDAQLEDEAANPVVTVKVSRGDTLASLLSDIGIDSDDAHHVINAIKRVFNPRNLRIGQEIAVLFDPSEDGLNPGRFQGVALEPEPGREVRAHRDANSDDFEASEIKKPLTKHLVRARGEIDTSLFESARALGISHPVLSEMIRVLSYDVDFQREVQPGDTYEVMFERYYDESGKLVRDGGVQYVAMELSGAPLNFYRHVTPDGFTDFYTPKGQSVRKALLRTPIDGAKLTSGFGLRKHPILGYSRMHQGIDFGAAVGTPIMAAGDGVVEMAGHNGAYGNYVRVKHAANYSTAYAHMSRIAAGVVRGKRVQQGQIIGYVGTTGLSTGPHLHYEVLVAAKQINPLSVKLPSGRKLEGKEFEGFKLAKTQTDKMLASLAPQTALARK